MACPVVSVKITAPQPGLMCLDGSGNPLRQQGHQFKAGAWRTSLWTPAPNTQGTYRCWCTTHKPHQAVLTQPLLCLCRGCLTALLRRNVMSESQGISVTSCLVPTQRVITACNVAAIFLLSPHIMCSLSKGNTPVHRELQKGRPARA